MQIIAGSSNGRTSGFGPEYLGSNPSPAAAKSGFAASRQADLSEPRDGEQSERQESGKLH